MTDTMDAPLRDDCVPKRRRRRRRKPAAGPPRELVDRLEGLLPREALEDALEGLAPEERSPVRAGC
jgi:hypothetical protein